MTLNAKNNIGVAIILLIGLKAIAEDAPAADPNASLAAAEAIESARQAYVSSRYEDAFARLDGLLTRPDAAVIFGKTALLTGRYDDALRVLAPFIAGPDGQMPKPNVEGRLGFDILCLYGELLMNKGELTLAARLFEIAWQTGRHARSWQFRYRIAQIRGESALVSSIRDDFYALYDETPVETDEPMIFAYTARVIEDESPADESPANALNEGYATAQKLLERRKAFEPEAYLWAGELLLRYFAYGQVAQEYKYVLDNAPNHPDAIIGSATLYLIRGDYQSAKDRIDAVLKTNPKHEGAGLLLAQIGIAENDEPSVINAPLDAIIATNPYCLDAQALLAASKLLHGDVAGYEQIRRAVLGDDGTETNPPPLNSTYADFYNIVGEMLQLRHREADAQDAFKRALALKSMDWRANNNMAMASRRLGDLIAARRHIEQAFTVNPYNVQAKNTKVVLYKLIGGTQFGKPIAPQFDTFETPHFVARVNLDERPILGPYLMEFMEDIRKELNELWRFAPKGFNDKILVELFPTADDFSVGTTGLPDLPANGATFGQVITLMSPNVVRAQERESFNWRTVFKHEYQHTITLQLSDYRIPRWATEGMSVSSENDPRIQLDRIFVEAYENGLIPKLRDFEKGFTRELFPGCILLHYYLAGKYVDYWRATYGQDAIRSLCVEWKNGKTDEQAIQATFGKPLSDMDDEVWEKVIEPLRAAIPLSASPTPESIELLRMQSATDPANANRIAALAKELFRAGEIQESDALVAKALEMDPKQADALILRAIRKLSPLPNETPDFAKAYENATAALVSAPNDFFAHLIAGQAALKLNKAETAVEHLQRAKDIYPRHYGSPDNGVYYLLADAQVKTGNPAAAVQTLLAYLKVSPDSEPAARKATDLAFGHSLDAEALDAAISGIYINPFDIKNHLIAGEILYRRGDDSRSAREFRVATAIDAFSFDAWFGLARASKRQGDMDGFNRAYAEAQRIAPGNLELRALRDGSNPR